MIPDRARTPFAFAVITIFAGSLSSCDLDESPMNPRGRLGEPCPVCPESECNSGEAFFAHCDCDACLSFGYDPDQKLLLSCTSSGVWTLLRECPGGVHVACASRHGGYEIECIGADGGEQSF